MKPFSDSENLTIERWQELEHTNPHYLAKLLEQRSSEAMPEVYNEAFKSGIPVSYRDPEYENGIVQEHPDGKRFLLNVFFDEKLKRFIKEVIKEIPKRK
jgi:hypothetical protein